MPRAGSLVGSSCQTEIASIPGTCHPPRNRVEIRPRRASRTIALFDRPQRARTSGLRRKRCSARVGGEEATGSFEDAELRVWLPGWSLPWAGHECRVGSVESEAAVELVRVGRVQKPAQVAERTVVDRFADQFDAETSTAIGGQDVDVGEMRDVDAVREHPRESDELVAVIEANDAGGGVQGRVEFSARALPGPVGLLAEEGEDGLAVDASWVIVKFEVFGDDAAHEVISI